MLRNCAIRSEQRRSIGEGSNPPADPGSVPIIETDFAELSDGSLIEMIENPKDPANSLFAVYKNGTLSYATMFHGKNQIFAPLRRQDPVLKHMLFPRGVIPHESLKTLLIGILRVILQCMDLEETNAFLVSHFVLSTWFIERLSIAPYLAIVGPPHSGKTTLLELLNLLCRHALLTSDISSAAFYDVYNKLPPTLLVDETLTAPDKRALFHLMRAGTTRGSVAFRKGRSLKAFGPKVISWTEMPNDAALNSRCIIIPMQETSRADLKKPTDKCIVEATERLRMALLDYRLRNYSSLHLPKIEGDECLYSRTRDLYQALALPVGSSEKFCKFLVDRFKHQQEINREHLSPAAAATLRSLYIFIHSHPNAPKCANKELMMAANLNPGSLPLNGHEVGRALTSLGFTDRKRTNVGYIVWLDLQTRKRIHKLAHDHGIDKEILVRARAEGCDLCANLTSSKSGDVETKEDSGVKPGEK